MGRDEVMRVVLDTNALIWLVRGDADLGIQSKELADLATFEDSLFVSAMSFWEIGMLVSKDRLRLDRPMTMWRRDVLDQGIEEIPLTGGVAMISTTLSGLPNDPADRIIAATAITIGGTLMTADGKLLRWDGALDRHDART